jgi:hypothetical protein
MRLDSSGNLGLGVTPPNAKYQGYYLKGSNLVDQNGVSCQYNQNAYLNSTATGWIYTASNYATQYQQYNGTHAWFTAPSGTAGNAVSFTQAMTLDNSGNLLVGGTTNIYGAGGRGTIQLQGTTATYGLVISGTDGGYLNHDGSNVSLANSKSGYMAFLNNGAERMRIDSSGNVGIGLLSPQTPLDVNGVLTLRDSALTGSGRVEITSVAFVGLTMASGNYVFKNNTNTSEYARIDSGGNLLVGTTSPYLSTNSFFKTNGASLPTLYLLKNSSAASTDQAFCIANGLAGGTVSFQVLANGNAQNTNNSYGAISDIKLKENIVDATPKLADLMQVKIRNYNFKSDETKAKQIGVVAQELESVFPAMIEETSDADKYGNSLGTTTKSVKYSVFVPMLIKAIQEQQAIIESLTTRLTALENK